MSLPKLQSQRSFLDTDQVVGRLAVRAPAGAARFIFFAEKIWPELVKLRPQLEAMYCMDNGRPAEEPVRMLGILILQFMERLPDRQAADTCTWDARWKMALHMEIDEPGIHPTTLVKYRNRLVENGLERLGFEGILNAMREEGYLPKKTRQRLDSSHVVGLVSNMSRLECVRETIRLALEALEPIERVVRPEAWPVWWERYVESKLDYKARADQLRLKMDQAGEDVRSLLSWARRQEAIGEAAEALELLERVYSENFEEVDEGGMEQRNSQPPGAVRNPHDPEAQWSAKDNKLRTEWVGYKVQVAETVEEEPRGSGEPTRAVLTAVVTQKATSSDKAALPVVEEEWKTTKQQKPDELYVDAGYTSGAEIARAEAEGRKLKGPVQLPSKKKRRITPENFEVSVEQRRAVCPGGHTSSISRRIKTKKTGQVRYRFEWDRRVCQSCKLRSQCLGQGKHHRILEIGEHHEWIQARRREQRTEDFLLDMHHRNGIEGTISELVRGYGMRRSRYRGQTKTGLQNWFIGAACNLKRWCRRREWEFRQEDALIGVKQTFLVAA